MRAHAKKGTRITHYCACAAGVLAVVGAVVSADPWVLVFGFAISLTLTFAGHLTVEKNCPTLLVHPLWALAGCLRLSFSALTGHLAEDMEKAGLPPPRS